jgi:hypothetical protein
VIICEIILHLLVIVQNNKMKNALTVKLRQPQRWESKGSNFKNLPALEFVLVLSGSVSQVIPYSGVVFMTVTKDLCGPGSVVGITVGYGLDGPGMESRWERDFPRLSRPAMGPTQPPVQWVPRLSGGGGRERPGRDADSSPHSSVEI